jgi:hypothetical protein
MNLSRAGESAWKPDPKAQRTTKANEMNLNPNLAAFSWKSMQATVGRRTASPSMTKTLSFLFTLASASAG